MFKKLNQIVVMTAAAVMVSSCATMKGVVKEPEVSVSDIQVKAVSLSDMKVDFTLGVKNPNPLGLKLNGMSYKLDIDDKSLLSGDNRQKLKLKANGSSSLTLPLSINYKDLAGGIGALMKKDQVHYSLSGDLDFGLARVPYKKQGVLKLPSLPKLSVAWINVDRMTLSDLDLTLVLQLDNRNNFKAKIDGIRYNLKVADTRLLTGRALRPFTLRPNAVGRLGIGIKLRYNNLGHLINKLLSSKSVPLVFEGEMAIAGAGKIPIKWQGEAPIQH